jgi:hypothetical protein
VLSHGSGIDVGMVTADDRFLLDGRLSCCPGLSVRSRQEEERAAIGVREVARGEDWLSSCELSKRCVRNHEPKVPASLRNPQHCHSKCSTPLISSTSFEPEILSSHPCILPLSIPFFTILISQACEAPFHLLPIHKNSQRC